MLAEELALPRRYWKEKSIYWKKREEMELPAFKDDSNPQKNVVFERHQLWSHQRTAGTSVDRFITELRQKSKDCEFGMSENDMLRDKLVFSITDSPLKERLLQERGLTLHRAIEICRVTEQVKTPLQAMKTEHGMKEVQEDAGMKRILPDQSLHHNSRKHLGHQSVQNMDQTEKLMLAAFMPKVQLHRFQLQQPSVTDCFFSETKNVEQLLAERLHIKEEPETLSEGQEENQLCSQQETNSSACPVQCEDEEEKHEASQLHWRQQTETNIKEEPLTCTLDELMKRQTVVMNSKEPESARNPDPSSLVLQGTDGTTTDSPPTEDGNKEAEDEEDNNDWQEPLSDIADKTNDFVSTSKKRKMFAYSENPEMRRKASKTKISSNKKVQEKLKLESVTSSTACVDGKKERLNKHSNGGLVEMRTTGQKPFQCDICGKYFNQKLSLNIHTRLHTGEKPYKCDLCIKYFNQKSHLVSHLRVHKKEKPFKCDKCGKDFYYKHSLTRHVIVHTGEKPFGCDFCKKRYYQKSNLNTHLYVHTGEKQFECEICSKAFYQKSQLVSHMRVHKKEKQFQCKDCGKHFSQNQSLKKHMGVHTGEKLFGCDFCHKRYYSKVNLNIHTRVHTGEKPFQCDICSKHFNQKCNFDRHLRVHKKEKPFDCKDCGKHFSLNQSLKRHMYVHTEEKSFGCDVCGKYFYQKQSLKNHLRVHEKEKLFECKDCSKHFSHNYSLKNHMRVHTGEKLFGCDFCHKRYSSMANLNIHLNVHTGEKPFQCNICSKWFYQKSHFVSHMRVHRKEKPFECDNCGKHFYHNHSLKRHMKLHTG